MNKLSKEEQVRVVSALVEGMSLRSIVRMTGVSKVTILKLLKDLGCACAEYHEKHVRNLHVRRVQCDEIWSFIQKKEKQCGPGDDPNFGDAYCFVAIERHSKLVLNAALGKRRFPFQLW